MYRLSYADDRDLRSVQITADSLDELFKGAAEAWKKEAVDEFEFVPDKYDKLEVSAAEKESLLIDFLTALNDKLNADFELAGIIVNIEISFSSGIYSLTSILRTGQIDFHTAPVKDEIKSFTVHQIEFFPANNIVRTALEFNV